MPPGPAENRKIGDGALVGDVIPARQPPVQYAIQAAGFRRVPFQTVFPIGGIGDLIKVALAAGLFPLAWRAVEKFTAE